MIDCQQMIQKGICKYADCCGCVQIPMITWDAHKDKIQRPVVQLLTIDREVCPLTSDHFCVFLSSEKKCVIYNERPDICQRFGTDNEDLACPYCKPNGGVRSEASKKQVMRRMANFQKRVLKNIRRMAQ